MLKLRASSPARAVIAASLLTVTCCQTPQPVPPPAPTPAPVATQAPPPQTTLPPATNWIDRPQTVGDWQYMGDQDGASQATFVRNGQVAFGMTCRPSGRIALVVPGAAGPQMVVRTETANRMFTGNRQDGALSAELDARDPLLDAMAITRGRFAIEAEGGQALYLPAWAEVTRVIEDCR